MHSLYPYQHKLAKNCDQLGLAICSACTAWHPALAVVAFTPPQHNTCSCQAADSCTLRILLLKSKDATRYQATASDMPKDDNGLPCSHCSDIHLSCVRMVVTPSWPLPTQKQRIRQPFQLAWIALKLICHSQLMENWWQFMTGTFSSSWQHPLQ